MSTTLRPKETVATFTLASEGSGVAQRIRVGDSTHVFDVDAAPAFGGHDRAPSPISYALGALISCNQVTAQIVAKEFGITLDRFDFQIRADLDTAVLVGGSTDANANFERVRVDATIATSATDDEFARLKTETERRCPIAQLFVRSGVDVTSVWHRATP